MVFDWNGLSKEQFEDRYCKRMKQDRQITEIDPNYPHYWCEFDGIGWVRVGELCFDLLLRFADNNNPDSDLVLTFDCYAGGVVCSEQYGPYAYSDDEPDYPYEDIGGDDFPTDCTEYTYEEFQRVAEEAFRKFIINSGKNEAPYNYGIDLVPLAAKPLHLW